VKLLVYQFSLPDRETDLRLSFPGDLTREELSEIETLFRIVVRSQLRRLQEPTAEEPLDPPP
jgi:hypothetical protein